MNMTDKKKAFINNLAETLIQSNESVKTEITINVPNIDTSISVQSFIQYNDLMIVCGVCSGDKKCVVDSSVLRRSIVQNNRDRALSIVISELEKFFDGIMGSLFKGFDFLHNVDMLDVDINHISLDNNSIEKFSDRVVDNFIAIDNMKAIHFNTNKQCKSDLNIEETLFYIMTNFIISNDNICEIEFINKEYGVCIVVTLQKTILCGKYVVGVQALRTDSAFKDLMKEDLPITDRIYELDILCYDVEDINNMKAYDILNSMLDEGDSGNIIAKALASVMTYYHVLGLSYSINLYTNELNDNEKYV